MRDKAGASLIRTRRKASCSSTARPNWRERSVEDRGFLAHPEAHRAFIASDVLRRIGGTAAVEALIDGLYDRLEADGALRPLFGRDLANGREAQKRFFVEWLGGESSYSSTTHL